MVNKETIIKRDKERPKDCQMGERSLILLNEFKDAGYKENFIFDTSDLTVEKQLKN